MSSEVEDKFIEALLALRKPGGQSNEDASRELRQLIIRLGSDTPDNRSCTEQIEVGVVHGPPGRTEVRGVKLANKNLQVAGILSACEGEGVPASVSAAYPGVSGIEWDACVRVAVLVLTLFERREWRED